MQHELRLIRRVPLSYIICEININLFRDCDKKRFELQLVDAKQQCAEVVLIINQNAGIFLKILVLIEY